MSYDDNNEAYSERVLEDDNDMTKNNYDINDNTIFKNE